MVKDLNTTTKNYVKKSLMTFIEGGKYTKNKKPLTLNWMTGVIRNSGIKLEILEQIFNEFENFPQNQEERSRFNLVLEKCKEANIL